MLQIPSINANESSMIQQVLDTHRNEIKQQICSLKREISEHENTLDSLYKQSLQRMPYHLHGVCIHEGSAESGHYYSFIRDHTQNVWRKYNDHTVTTVDEEQVLLDANGGHAYRSAYYLIYLSDSEVQSLKFFDVNRHDPDAGYQGQHEW